MKCKICIDMSSRYVPVASVVRVLANHMIDSI